MSPQLLLPGVRKRTPSPVRMATSSAAKAGQDVERTNLSASHSHIRLLPQSEGSRIAMKELHDNCQRGQRRICKKPQQQEAEEEVDTRQDGRVPERQIETLQDALAGLCLRYENVQKENARLGQENELLRIQLVEALRRATKAEAALDSFDPHHSAPSQVVTPAASFDQATQLATGADAWMDVGSLSTPSVPGDWDEAYQRRLSTTAAPNSWLRSDSSSKHDKMLIGSPAAPLRESANGPISTSATSWRKPKQFSPCSARPSPMAREVQQVTRSPPKPSRTITTVSSVRRITGLPFAYVCDSVENRAASEMSRRTRSPTTVCRAVPSSQPVAPPAGVVPQRRAADVDGQPYPSGANESTHPAPVLLGNSSLYGVPRKTAETGGFGSARRGVNRSSAVARQPSAPSMKQAWVPSGRFV